MLKKTLKVRFTKDKIKKNLVVVIPDYQAEQEMRIAYAKAYRQAIQQGVATRPSMLELMRDEGIWTPKMEDELTNLTIHAALLEAALEGQEDKKEQKKLVIELTKVRSQIYDLVNVKTLPLEHTAEQIAEDVKLDYYIALCTRDENGVKYFKSHQDFLDRRNDVDAKKIFDAVVGDMSKENIEMLRQLPEHEWLMENEYMDKDGKLIDKAIQEELDVSFEKAAAEAEEKE